MAVDAGERWRAPIVLSFGSNLIIALAVLALGGAAMLRYGADSAALHTVLDTSVALTGALIALLLWDISRRSDQSWPLFLAIAFAVLAIGELVHTLTALGWLSIGRELGSSEVQWRAGTWGPPAHLLPIGVGAALLLRHRSRSMAWPLTLALFVVAIGLIEIFLALPRYTDPGLLGITRPSLVLVPLLWVAVGIGYWRQRDTSEIARAVALTAIVLTIAHIVMLYSKAPSDPVAMVAHLGKFIGDALLLFNLTQIGAADTARRRRAEQELLRLNQELDARVNERTVRLRESNERMHLLDQVTRAIGQRQDVRSIFQVVVRTLEDRLPADFACMCLYDRVKHVLRVAHVGVGSVPLGQQLGMTEHAEIAIDQNGLSRCLRGELVYELDITSVDFPFPQRLAARGLRSLVIAPLVFETEVFGVMVVSRLKTNAFLSTDCEFLKQLGEHVALAAHQAQMRDSLQQAYDDLRLTQQAVLQQERMKAIGQMASGIAHDINNAISPVAVYTQSLLESTTGLEPRVLTYLQTVRRVINDVTATVARMREFYRPRDEQIALRPVALNELVAQVIEMTRARWSDIPQRNGIAIDARQELESDLPLVPGVESELRDALTNLVFNAVDAMPEGGALTISTRTVELQSQTASGQPIRRVQLRVADTGAGMSEAVLQRCFEPFYTTKGERGTGLGLPMVQATAQHHNAEIGIESAPGKGTTIVLTFPIAAAGADRSQPQAVAPEHLSALRLLMIDDDPFVLDSMQTVLELDGHAVVQANGGQAGIDAFLASLSSGQRFDAVITDLGMPGVDGNKVTATLKAASPDTPVILLTGWGRRLQTPGAGASQADFILPKPPDLEELRAVFAKIRRH
jgi:signal transduction histidine kinase/ActR/RegA family two-component response regulator